jgi:hypothetical protein
MAINMPMPKGMSQIKKYTADKYFWLYAWIDGAPIDCRFDCYEEAVRFLATCDAGWINICHFKYENGGMY